MRGLSTRLPHRRVIGLQVGDREVVRTDVALTPLGPVAVDRRSTAIGAAGPAAAAAEVLGPREGRGRWRDAPVAVGLPVLVVFFGARAGGGPGDDVAPALRLGEVMDTSSVAVEELEIDAVTTQVGGRPACAVAACRRAYLGSILEALEGCGARPWRVEPSPCALLRASARRARPPRRAKLVARVFLGQREGMALLESDGLPLAWRPFEIGSEGPAQAALAQSRMLAALGLRRGLGEPEALLLHGRSAPSELAEPPTRSQAAGGGPIPVRRFDAPGLEPESYGIGLALGVHDPRPALNLARASRPPAPILGLLPWGQLAAQVALVAGATLVLQDRLHCTRQELDLVEADRSTLVADAKKSLSELLAERAALAKRIEALGQFLGDRIAWSPCLDQVATQLPSEMVVTSLEGRSEFKSKKSAKGSRSLTVAFEAPIRESVSVPPEIGGLLDALRAGPALKQELPTVEMATLRWNQVGQAKSPMANFTVVCSPRAESKTRPTAPASGGGERVAAK